MDRWHRISLDGTTTRIGTMDGGSSHAGRGSLRNTAMKQKRTDSKRDCKRRFLGTTPLVWDRLTAAARINPKLTNYHGNYETRPQRRFLTTGWFWHHYDPTWKQHQRAGQYVESPTGDVRSAEASDMLRMRRSPSG